MAKLNSGTRIYGNVTIDTFATATGNITGGNILTGGLISATGAVTAASVVGGVITGTSVSVTGAQSAASTVGGVITGTSTSVSGTTTAASIVGGVITGTSVSVSGAVTGAALTGTSLTVTTGNITGGNLILSGVITDTTELTIQTTAANGNITLTPNGIGNVNTGANISVTGRVTAASVVGGVITGSSTSVTGTTTAASVVGGVITGSSTSVTGTTTTGGTTTSAGFISQTQASNVMSRMSLVNSVRNWSISNYGNQFSPNSSFNIADETGGTVRLQITTDGNLTATGNLTASGILSATGNVQGGNLRTAGLISATGSITGASVVGGVITGTSTSVTGAVTGASLAGTITTAAQTNITSVGTLSSVSVSGNVQGGNLRTAGLISATGAVTAASLVGTITTAAQTNITSVGTLSSLTMGGLLTGYSSTNTDVNTANDGGSFSARGNASTIASMTFHRTGAYAINMGLGVDNIFRIGGWSASNNCMQLSGAGAMTILSSLTLNSASGVTAIVNGGSNGVGNIGSSTTYFNTVFAKATSAQYADLAENYLADADYPPGTVLIFGGNHEVTVSGNSHSSDIAGVVSTDPAYIMNSGLDSGHVATVALLGRVPCQVVGMVRKGQCVVASDQPGTACALDPNQYQPGCIIGKALEDYNNDLPGTIEVVVGRL